MKWICLTILFLTHVRLSLFISLHCYPMGCLMTLTATATFLRQDLGRLRDWVNITVPRMHCDCLNNNNKMSRSYFLNPANKEEDDWTASLLTCSLWRQTLDIWLRLIFWCQTHLHRHVVDVDELKRCPDFPVHLESRPESRFQLILKVCVGLPLQRAIGFHIYNSRRLFKPCL